MLLAASRRLANSLLARRTAILPVHTAALCQRAFLTSRLYSNTPGNGNNSESLNSTSPEASEKKEPEEPSESLDSVQAFIEKVVKENEIVVFMKGTIHRPMCGFSRLATQVLQLQGVPKITSVNVLEDESLREGVKKYTNWPTIPQIFVKGEFLGGSDIILNMYHSGELKTTLLEKGISLSEPEKDPLEPPMKKE